LWRNLTQSDDVLDRLCSTPDVILRERYRMRGWTARIALSAQYRLLRAVLLLLGDSGMRREVAALASRSKLKPLLAAPGLWELEVLGKRNQWRTVFLPERAIVALRANWQDRALDFDFGMATIPWFRPSPSLRRRPRRRSTRKRMASARMRDSRRTVSVSSSRHPCSGLLTMRRRIWILMNGKSFAVQVLMPSGILSDRLPLPMRSRSMSCNGR